MSPVPPTTPAPTFLIIGAAKAGTTSLHTWLAQHPDVCMSRPKETQFFTLHHDRGLAHYATFFPHWNGEPVRGESTPVYLSMSSVPGRIATTLPDVKLVAILRDPAEQAFSAWWMMRMFGVERRGFPEVVEAELRHAEADGGEEDPEQHWGDILEGASRGRPHRFNGYLRIGRYVEALNRYRDHFPADQLRVFLYDDLQRDPTAFAGAVCDFLDIAFSRAPSPSLETRNQARGPAEAAVRRHLGRRAQRPLVLRVARRAAREIDRRRTPPRLDPTSRARLDQYFAVANEGLGELLGRDVSHWYQL